MMALLETAQQDVHCRQPYPNLMIVVNDTRV